MELTLMFSYQTDLEVRASKRARQEHHTHTDFLKYCIQEAIKKVEHVGDLRHVGIRYTDTTMEIRNDEGIGEVVKRLTDSCHIFVADLTCTRMVDKFILLLLKLRLFNTKNEGNSNVSHEYALVKNRLGQSGVIKVMNVTQGDPNKDDKCIPVDFRNTRYPIGYIANIKDEFSTIDEKEKKSLIEALANALREAAHAAVELKAKEYLPFIGWDEHDKRMQKRCRFVRCDVYNDIQNKVLSADNSTIRIKGISGMGKTRMILEAFRDKEERFNYLYADYYDIEKTDKVEEFYDQLNNIFSDTRSQDLILVIDNCDKNRWSDIVDKRRAARSRIKLIGITHDMLELFGSKELPIEVPKHMPEVVTGILEERRRDFDPRYKERIEQFAGGIPLMAHLLLDGLQENRALGDINEETIWDKVFGYRADSRERKILQTIALFNWIGYADDRAVELEFVATNKHITSLDGDDQVITNDFRRQIVIGLQRGFIEQRGRLISIRPKPLAMRLIGEWIKGCDKERIKNVMREISTHETLNEILSSAFSDQMRDMRYLEDEGSNLIIDTIFAADSPFVNAEVLNSEMGSHLFRAFVEVDPETIAERLWQILSPLTIEELRMMELGRRNLVWTLEKLCFISQTFSKGAEMMLRFAIAENEHFSNNATGQFVRLFFIHLAATEVDYSTRIDFLKRMINTEIYHPFVLRAIDAALGTSHPVFISGAEKFGTDIKVYYQPKNTAESRQYCIDCLGILSSFMQQGTYEREIKQIICDSIWYQAIIGNLDIYIPYIDAYIAKDNGKWSEMLEILQRIVHDERIALLPEEDKFIKEKIEQLTQLDFVSRFKYVEQKWKWDFSIGTDRQTIISRDEYISLAQEFAKSYRKEDLSQIYAMQVFNADAFGTELANCLSSDQAKLIIDDSITILEQADRKYNSIFISFCKSVPEEVYAYLKNAIVKTALVELLFPIVAGRSERMDNADTDYLFELAKNGKVSVAFFTNYLSNFRFDKMDDEQMAGLLKKIVELNVEDSLNTAISLGSSYAHWFSDRCEQCTQYLRKVMMTRIQEISKPLLDDISFHHIVNQLLDGKFDFEWADWVGGLYANQLAQDLSIIQYNPYANETLRILLSQYFVLMWGKIEEVYENVDEYTRYRMGNVIGVMQGAERGSLGTYIFIPEHDDILLAWCQKHPQYAPMQIARIAPLYGTDGQFTHLIRTIIDEYGAEKYVLGELSANMGSMLTVGSAVEPHRHQLDVLKPLINHKLSEVRQWASKMISDVQMTVQQIQTMEDEMVAKYC